MIVEGLEFLGVEDCFFVELEVFFVAVNVVGDDHAAAVDAVFYCVEIIDVFVFGSVEEGQVECFWCGGDRFRGVAEDLGDVWGETGFFEVFGGQPVAFFLVRLDGVEHAAGVREGFG